MNAWQSVIVGFECRFGRSTRHRMEPGESESLSQVVVMYALAEREGGESLLHANPLINWVCGLRPMRRPTSSFILDHPVKSTIMPVNRISPPQFSQGFHNH